MPSLEQKIRDVLNAYSAENTSNTPDFVLAKFLIDCLAAFNTATIERTRFYNPEIPAEQ